MTDLRPFTEKAALFSWDGRYRYWLRRDLAPLLGRRPALWVLLNPSTAGHTKNDPTTTLTSNISARHGYGVHAMVNLHAFVATDPGAMPDYPESLGGINDDVIRAALEWCDRLGGDLVAAWGAGGGIRAGQVLDILGERPLLSLGANRDGSPRFPRAIGPSVRLEAWPPEAGR